MICLSLYRPTEPDDSERNSALNEAEFIFTIIFTVELVLKMMAIGPREYFNDGFNYLDFLIVFFGWIGLIPGINSDNLSAVRTLRVLRPLRTITIFPGLRLLVKTTITALPMVFTVVLLALYLFVLFGIYGIQTYSGILRKRCVQNEYLDAKLTLTPDELDRIWGPREGYYDELEFCRENSNGLWPGHLCQEGMTCVDVENPNFGFTSFDTLLWALLLVFQCVTLEGWTDIMYWTMDASSGLSCIYYIILIFIGAFFLLNLALAVISNVHEASMAAEDKDDVEEEGDADEHMTRTEEEQQNMWFLQKKAWSIISTTTFTNTVTSLIILNTIVLAANYSGASNTYLTVLETMNLILTIAFLVEMVLKFVGLGPHDYVSDKFNIFDTFVNIGSLVELIFFRGGSLSALRAVRILRVLKLAGKWPPLQNFLLTLFMTVQELGNFSAIVLLVIFVFSLLGMQMFGGKFDFGDETGIPRSNFDTLLRSFVTVFQVLTGEDWNVVMYNGMRSMGEWGSLYFVFLVLIGNYVVVNLFIAILLASFDNHRKAMVAKQQKEALRKIEELKASGALDEEKSVGSTKKLFRRLTKSKRSKSNGSLVTETSADESSINGSTLEVPLTTNIPTGESLEEISKRTRDNMQARLIEFEAKHPNGHHVQQPKEKYPKEMYPKDAENPLTSVKKDSTRGLSRENPLAQSTIRIATSSSSIPEAGQGLLQHALKRRDESPPKGKTTTRTGRHPAELNSAMMEAMCVTRPKEEEEEEEEEDNRIKYRPLAEFELKSMGIFSNTHPIRVWMYKVVDSMWFERIVLLLITFNCIEMAMESPDLDDKENWHQFFRASNLAFVIIFAMEFFMKIIALGLYGEEGTYIKDNWNVLDGAIVVLSLFDMTAGAILNTDLAWIRALRALRPLRMINKAPNLKVVVHALFASIPALSSVLMVALLFWLVFGILGMSLFMDKFGYCTDPDRYIVKENCTGTWDPTGEGFLEERQWKKYNQNFDNIFKASTTLFEMSTTEQWLIVMWQGVDAVAEDKNPRRDNNEYMVFFFVLFMLFGSFFLVNLFVGIIMDSFATKQQEIGTRHLFLTSRQVEWLNYMELYRHLRPIKSVEHEIPWRRKMYAFVTSPWFENGIIVAILLNALVMTTVHEGQSQVWTDGQEMANEIFKWIFAAEAVFKLLGFGIKEYFRSRWNTADLIIVVLSFMSLNTSFLRLLRITRVLRVVKETDAFLTLFDTLLNSLPTLINVGALLLLVFFVYAILGVNLFGKVNRNQTFLNRQANFSNFGWAMLTLFRCVTGEAWNGIMYDCMVEPPFCDDDNNPNNDFGCGNAGAAYFFFVSFVIVGNFIVLNLFLAVVLEQYNNSAADTLISEKDVLFFRELWSTFDRQGLGVMPAKRLPHFLELLPPPLGLRRDRSGSVRDLDIMKLKFILLGSDHRWASFHDVLFSLVTIAVRDPEQAMPKEIARIMDKLLTRTRTMINVMTNKEMAVYFKDTVTMLPVPVPPSTDMTESEFSNDVLLAARLVQHHFRHFQARKYLMAQLPDIKVASTDALRQSCPQLVGNLMVDLNEMHNFQMEDLMPEEHAGLESTQKGTEDVSVYNDDDLSSDHSQYYMTDQGSTSSDQYADSDAD
eukprot:CAMPEP_0118927358 /NCGR_PEP_ID=MMETSP1169-20130426/4846_1 /TAXON_ID=36882 /ORGANISM="Pyramimonas obovata, Strain CCMP722" /LENGTH=1618 /DNA_ID=CAMNT_0006869105 /DNA_START=431 /DNA_END=5287 /DNA_ORIENTATION=+